MVYKTNNYGLWYLKRTSYWGESKATNIAGGAPLGGSSHLVSDL